MKSPPILAVAAVLVALPALAQELPEAALRWFESYDQDKDGILTPEEYGDVAEKQFGRVDGNGDGTIDEGEYVFGIPEDRDEEIERARKRFAIMDSNGDGGATLEEYVGFGRYVIETADGEGDQDGKMSREEFAFSVTPNQ
jgi:hypothetical protein